MSETIIEQLQAIDLQVLNRVVRQDQDCPDFHIYDWSVKKLSDVGVINPDGLFLFYGHGGSPSRDGQAILEWSVVLKTIKHNEHDLGPRSIWYWRREIDLMQSGLLENLLGPVVAPKVYEIREDANGAWIWMEYIQDISPEVWTAEEYFFAGNQVGQMDGAYLSDFQIPDYPWLCDDECRAWDALIYSFPNVDPEVVWANPRVREVYPGEDEVRAKRIFAEKERFFTAMKSLPQLFGHFDMHRMNLMIRTHPGGQKELVAIDWALSGIGPRWVPTPGPDDFGLGLAVQSGNHRPGRGGRGCLPGLPAGSAQGRLARERGPGSAGVLRLEFPWG